LSFSCGQHITALSPLPLAGRSPDEHIFIVWATRHCLNSTFSRREVPGRTFSLSCGQHVTASSSLSLAGRSPDEHLKFSTFSFLTWEAPRQASESQHLNILFLDPHSPPRERLFLGLPLAPASTFVSSIILVLPACPEIPARSFNMVFISFSYSFFFSLEIIKTPPSFFFFFSFWLCFSTPFFVSFFSCLPPSLRTPLPTPITQTSLPPLLGLLVITPYTPTSLTFSPFPLYSTSLTTITSFLHRPTPSLFTFLYLIFIHLIISSSHFINSVFINFVFNVNHLSLTPTLDSPISFISTSTSPFYITSSHCVSSYRANFIINFPPPTLSRTAGIAHSPSTSSSYSIASNFHPPSVVYVPHVVREEEWPHTCSARPT
jgi:hypothetical protein